jgi:hypothetical protein
LFVPTEIFNANNFSYRLSFKRTSEAIRKFGKDILKKPPTDIAKVAEDWFAIASKYKKRRAKFDDKKAAFWKLPEENSTAKQLSDDEDADVADAS